jgi:hypothetical protein
MNIDAKRHKLLEILSKQRNDLDLNKAEYNALGVSFEKIFEVLNCNEDELKLITSELYTSEEIGYHDAYNIVGLFAKDNGATAFSNKKYRKRIIERRKERIKFIVQTAIPILALIVAILSLSLKFDNLKLQSDKELNEIITKQKEQDNRLNNLELKTINQSKIDSLKNKKE